ncbi:MAG: transposase domain-containing protein, partial [Bacteroidetes bacterium]|nr:transposase domain-containing protein [Bacteroidota bacterium]
AQRAAILYSLLNTCTLHDVNPREWLVDVLTRIDTIPQEELYTLLPQHWKSTQQDTLGKAA